MGKAIVWEIIFLFEFFKYIIAYKIATKKWMNIKKSTLLVEILVSWTAILFMLDRLAIHDAYMILFLIAVIFSAIYMREKIAKRIWMTVILIFCVTAFDALFEKIVRMIFSNHPISREVEIIIWETMVASFLGLVLFVIKIMTKLKVKMNRKWSTLIICSSVVLADICLCMSAMMLLYDEPNNMEHFVYGILSFIAAAFLGCQIVRIFNLQESLMDQVEQERLLNGVQKEYYHSIIKKEEETRKYRHDMNNHFLVIESMLEKEKIKEVSSYIKNLKKDFSEKTMKKYYIGNDVIDALSEYYLSLLNESVDIKVISVVPDDIGIDEVDLCTIYSNLIKNSVEELIKLNNEKYDNLQLFVNFSMGKKYFKIEIKNTARENAQFNGIMTPTSKVDSKNHGIGLSNVKRVVDRVYGNFTLSQSDGMFCAEVIIPIS